MRQLHETNLPPKDAFYYKLTDEGSTDEDNQHTLSQGRIITTCTMCLMYIWPL